MTTRRRNGRNGPLGPEDASTQMEERLRALSPQRPSPVLRERVLRLARAALAPPVSWRARFWSSWGFRWGWAVGLVAMVVVGGYSQRAFESRMQQGSSEPRTASAARGDETLQSSSLVLQREGLLAGAGMNFEVADPNPWEKTHPLRETETQATGNRVPPGSRGALDPSGAHSAAGGRLS